MHCLTEGDWTERYKGTCLFAFFSAFSLHLHFIFSLALPLRSLRLCVILLFLFCFFTR
jgi:hypothetical protein